jgi:hypothetical protein
MCLAGIVLQAHQMNDEKTVTVPVLKGQQTKVIPHFGKCYEDQGLGQRRKE